MSLCRTAHLSCCPFRLGKGGDSPSLAHRENNSKLVNVHGVSFCCSFSKAFSISPACPAQKKTSVFLKGNTKTINSWYLLVVQLWEIFIFFLWFFCTWEIFNNDCVTFKIRKRNTVHFYFPKQLYINSCHSFLCPPHPPNIITALCLHPPNPLTDLMERLKNRPWVFSFYHWQAESFHGLTAHWVPGPICWLGSHKLLVASPHLQYPLFSWEHMTKVSEVTRWEQVNDCVVFGTPEEYLNFQM